MGVILKHFVWSYRAATGLATGRHHLCVHHPRHGGDALRALDLLQVREVPSSRYIRVCVIEQLM